MLGAIRSLLYLSTEKDFVAVGKKGIHCAKEKVHVGKYIGKGTCHLCDQESLIPLARMGRTNRGTRTQGVVPLGTHGED